MRGAEKSSTTLQVPLTESEKAHATRLACSVKYAVVPSTRASTKSATLSGIGVLPPLAKYRPDANSTTLTASPPIEPQKTGDVGDSAKNDCDSELVKGSSYLRFLNMRDQKPGFCSPIT